MGAPTFDFGEFPELATERLLLREFDTRDAQDIFAFRGDAEVQLYNSKPHASLEETLAFITEELAWYVQKKELIWALTRRDTRRVIGEICIFDWDRYHRHASIGYDMARASWGNGYMIEAARAVLQFGFERMQLNRIEIWTAAENQRSVRLAERLGFQREGTLRRRILEDDGDFHDGAVFGLLKSEWLQAARP